MTSPSPSSDEVRARFLHRHGRANVRLELDALLGSATNSLRIAACFITESGRRILSKHTNRLQKTDSCLVASVDFPTNLESLLKLHRAAPGNVFIHLGGRTPEEKKVGRSLMHSKVFLADGEDGCRLWVGSHNLTAMAIEGGNLEAAILLNGPRSSSIIEHAIAHLAACKNGAEVFDPAEMQRYRDIQKKWTNATGWDSEKNVLVIHAGAPAFPAVEPFIVHVNVALTKLDRLFQMDRPVRLFLHPPGSLRTDKSVDYAQATMWVGEITAVVRTELHPKHRGARGWFEDAQYDINVPNLDTIPTILPQGSSIVRPQTQVVIRLDETRVVGEEFYSTSDKSPLTNIIDCDLPNELHEVDADMAEFFTRDSLIARKLLYRRTVGMSTGLLITGYDETVRATSHRDFVLPDASENSGDVEYSMVKRANAIDPFFFLSKHVVRKRRETH